MNSTIETCPHDARGFEEVSRSNSSQNLNVVIQQWIGQHPGCTVEIVEEADAPASSDIPFDLLLDRLLQELTPFDLNPWDVLGMNKTLLAMRDKKVLFGVSAPELQERGITFLTPQLHTLREAAAEVGNEMLANFITQVTDDSNVSRIFCKFFPPGSQINSSGWHQDQGSEEQLSWSRCLIYMTSGDDESEQPLHYISFRRAGGRQRHHVRLGFPHSLAMSGPLRCGEVYVGDVPVEFEHRGEPPVSTACCFVMDVASIAQALDDYQRYVGTCSREASKIIIPNDLATSCNYSVVDGKLHFMDVEEHAVWLRETGMTEYWVRGGEIFKEANLNG